MKRTKILCFLLSATLAVTPSMSVVAAQNTSIENSTYDEQEVFSAGYVPLSDGYVPDVVNTNYDFEDDAVENLGNAGESVNALGADSSYVPVGESYIPGEFYNQEGYNMCWALSAVTACDINARKKGLDVKSMSAPHLAYYFYNRDEYVTDPKGNQGGDYVKRTNELVDWTMYGGNGRLAMWELASWMGVAGYDDTTSLYNFDNFSKDLVLDNTTEDIYLNDTAHVQNVYMSGLDVQYRDNVKTLIKEQGSVTAGYYTDVDFDSFYKKKSYDDGYATSYGNYYYDGSTYKDANHAITIIGWDDNYSKDNFVVTPEGDGAWLVLNSWGDENSSIAQSGLFWLSYYDDGLLQEGVAIGYDVESADNYDNVYQYDGSFGVATKLGNRFVQFFQVENSEQVRAASIGVADSDVEYTAKVYTFDENLSEDDIAGADVWLNDVLDGSSYMDDKYEITCSELCAKSGVFSYEGYHTVEFGEEDFLGENVLEAGSTVAVVFDFKNTVRVYYDMAYVESGTWYFCVGDDKYKGVTRYANDYNVMGNGTTLRMKLFTDNNIEGDLSLSLDEKEVTVDLKNESKTLGYTLVNTLDSDNYSVVFSVDKDDYISVGTMDGKIRPKKVGGPTVVTAHLYDESGKEVSADTCKVYVTSVLEKIELNKTALTLGIGESEALTCKLVPETAVDSGDMVWSSANEDIVTVDQNGKVVAAGYGETTVACKVGKFSAECKVAVVPKYTGVVIDKHEVTIKKGNSTRLTANVLPEDNTEIASFTWSSSDDTIATVDQDGKVTGVGYGEATITVTCGTFKDTCKVNVTGEMIGVELDRDTAAILKGRNVQLVAQAYPVDTADTVSYAWSSDNADVATVDQNGKVTGVGYGEATITVTCGAFKDTCKVIVSGQLAAVVLNKEKLILEAGKTATLTAKLEPAELAENQVIEWSSSNGKVATIDVDGKVTAVGEGTCDITVTCGTFKDTCKIIVDSLEILRDESVASSVNVSKGSTIKLDALWSVQNVPADVTWKSSNTNIAEVDESGVVTGVSEGVTTIYAMVSGSTFTKAVSVSVAKEGTENVKPDDETTKEIVRVTVTNASYVKELIVGQAASLNVSYTPVSLTDVSLEYYSSDSDVLHVSENGALTALKAGKANITVVVKGKEGSGGQVIPVTVRTSSGSGGSNSGSNTSSMNISVINMDSVKKLEVGKKVKADVQVTSVSGNLIPDAAIKYAADGVYVDVDSEGNLVGLKAGTGTITISAVFDGKVTESCFYVTVMLGANGMGTVNDDTATDDVEENGGNAGNSNKVPVISDTPAVEVGKEDNKSNGIATAEPGATEKEKVLVSRIVLKADTRQISSKGKMQIRATVKPSNAENKNLKWYSSNKKYATVDKNGLVRAKKAGADRSIIITCKATDGSGTVASYFIRITEDSVKKIKITTDKKVTKKVKNASGKTVKKKVNKKVSKITVKAGKSLKLDVKITTTGKDVNKKLVWASSNREWATVSSKGKVKTKKAGRGHTVTITASTIDGSKKGTFKLKIK